MRRCRFAPNKKETTRYPSVLPFNATWLDTQQSRGYRQKAGGRFVFTAPGDPPVLRNRCSSTFRCLVSTWLFLPCVLRIHYSGFAWMLGGAEGGGTRLRHLGSSHTFRDQNGLEDAFRRGFISSDFSQPIGDFSVVCSYFSALGGKTLLFQTD